LRTSFDLSTFSQPLQLVHNRVDIPLYIGDWRALLPDEQISALREWIDVELSRKFDLSQPPALRFSVHKRSDDSFQLTWTEHHALLDGWSAATFIAELADLYLIHLRGSAPSTDDPPKVAFRDYVALEEAALASPSQRFFWRDYLNTCQTCLLGTSVRNSSLASDDHIRSHRIEVSHRTLSRLLTFASSEEVSIRTVLLTAHVCALGQVLGRREILTGIFTHGRPDEQQGGDRILGLFLNVLPFRVLLSGGSWRDLVRTVSRIEQNIFPYRRFPLSELQRDMKAGVLFDTAFNFVNFHVTDNLRKLAGMTVLEESYEGENNFALTSVFTLRAREKLELSLHFDSSSVEAVHIDKLLKQYGEAFACLSDNPDAHYHPPIERPKSPQETQASSRHILGRACSRESIVLSPSPDSLEQQLLDVWREVVNDAPVGVTSSFIDSGVDSLQILRLSAVLTDRLGYRLSIADLCETQTIAATAALLRSRQRMTP
jgi:aryl carrier-like protein